MTEVIIVHRHEDGAEILLNRHHIVWAERNDENVTIVKVVTGEDLEIRESLTHLKPD